MIFIKRLRPVFHKTPSSRWSYPIVWIVANNICVFSVWRSLWITFLGPRTVRWLLHFWKIYKSLIVGYPYNAHSMGVTRWSSWLRHCTTNWKAAGSIPFSVIAIFNWHNPSGRTVGLRSTQPLTEMSTRNIFWIIKAAGRCIGDWQTYYIHVSIFIKSECLNLLETEGTLQACTEIALPLMHIQCVLCELVTDCYSSYPSISCLKGNNQ